MKPIVITGCAGYLGSLVTNILLADGCEVVGVDNFLWKDASRSAVERNFYRGSSFSFFEYDVRDEKWLDLLDNASVIVHLAGYVGADLCKSYPEEAHAVNYGSVEKLINKLKTLSSPPLVVFPDTNSSYGASENDALTEESPRNPLSGYGKSKMMAGDLVESFNGYQGIGESCVFRLATLFGSSPRMRMDLLPNHLVYRAYLMSKNTSVPFYLYEGHFKRNFACVEDVAYLFAKVAKQKFYFDEYGSHKKKLRGVYNLSDGRFDCTKLELLKRVFRLFGINENRIVHCDEKDPDGRNCRMSCDKLLREKFGNIFVEDMDSQLRNVMKICQLWDGHLDHMMNRK